MLRKDEAEIVADGVEDGVCGIAIAPFEVIATEVAVAFQMTDDRLNSRTPFHA